MMTDYWLIRLNATGSALIWKRKYFLGLIAIPWAFHGGSLIIRTPDKHDDVLSAAFDYINKKSPCANITVEMCDE